VSYPPGGVEQLESTRRDNEGDTEADGTQAASPRAIAEAAAVVPSRTPSQNLQPSNWATASARSVPSVDDALDNAELSRVQVFHIFGIFAPLVGIAGTAWMGGDPFAALLFRIGLAILSLCNVGLTYLSRTKERWKPLPVGVLWMIATVGSIPAMYYFGPFSAVVVILLLGVVFIALGSSRWVALSILAICTLGHLAVAVPIGLGYIDDVGILSSAANPRFQLWVAEVLLLAFLMSGYSLGRWARHSSMRALAELHAAMRVIGDQQQALAEAKDDVARQQRQNEGRWTGQMMGSFRLGVVLGRGAMGEVYEGFDKAGQQAAVKLLAARSDGSTALVERFHREIMVVAHLASPHIVKVFEISPPDAPVPYFAMERLFGTDLASKLRSENRMPSDELVLLLDQVARGLEVARLAGIVHRDLKPHNLFLHAGSTWKILDFGVSKVMGSEGTLTGEGIVGTPQYMAPEQASGGHVTHQSDVYALGAIAYRCLTGRSPFKGKDLAELVYQLVHTPPVRPGVLGRVSRHVEDVLAIAMAKDPRRRFPSAIAFSQAFIAARRGRACAIEPPPNAWL
jgi:eukaryotic-like serine/threonine-protein kinase